MFTKDISSTFEKNLKNEWLITNGIGGYASSTIIGVNTRKYHGLLVASLGNNMERVMTLSKFNEYVTIGDEKYSFSSNECQGYIEKGYVYQEAFERKMLPEFLFNVNGVEIAKKMTMQHGKNKVCIRYNIVNSLDDICYITLVPFVNYRDFHAVKNANVYEHTYEDHLLTLKVSDKNNLYIKITDGEFIEYENTFYNNMYYRVEENRGFDAYESQYMPGEFTLSLLPHEQKEIYVVAELNDKCTIDDTETPALIRAEETRLEKICKIASAKTGLEKDLVAASDQFIVNKGKDKSILAGYPWFTDWGRDAFISLEGLLLKLNRFPDAKAVLKYFANYIRNGLVPNYIDSNGGGSYNTVDASLWYIEAIYKYFVYTNDLNTIKELFPKVLEIIYSYMTGTEFGIVMDDDGLIMAGDSNTQLTWMDAKVGDHIPTPRYGKAVEINALWYNAIKVVMELNKILIKKYASDLQEDAKSSDILNAIYRIDLNDNGEVFDEAKTRDLFLSDKALVYYDVSKIVFDGRLIGKVKESFKKFYADDGLYDTIEPFNNQIRPNQIMALSLSFPVLTGDKAQEVLRVVKDNLYTSKGLKTLASSDSDYRGRYEGDSYSRDTSYHQGTVWPWLIGEYAKAFKYINKKNLSIATIQEMLDDGCVGSVCEIYDADEPRYPNGALAQAWSVAAILTILL
ncbi:MAG: glycogen debranching enzyme N-terminal domain-containing protein [Clostridia bacterium]|nr:glycogen debranching enzyme N-terminal domain-containing protein [Clostridia bacterium]